jgi:enterochelin esterase-like enzyme
LTLRQLEPKILGMRNLSLLALSLVFGSTLLAQAPARAGRGGGRGAAAATSPAYEVHPDRTVTFKLRAPEATTVTVSGDFAQNPLTLTKGTDGTWSVTSAALRPAIYRYAFTVNGVSMIDPANPMIGTSDRGFGGSLFEVKANQPSPWDVQDVPHGTVHINYYTSKKFSAQRLMYVYTPPGYDSTTTRYPALYLMHGAGGVESSWFTDGKANLILDNAIASGQAKPMIVVMPYGRPGQAATFGPSNIPAPPANGVLFPNDVVEDVIPFAEKNYRISPRPDDRAIAGLSMGGNQTLQVGLTHLDIFHYIGAFSPVVMTASAEQDFAPALADPSATNKKLKLFYIYCGKTDTLFDSITSFHKLLDDKKVAHKFVETEEWHVWRNWRDYLADFAPRLFR